MSNMSNRTVYTVQEEMFSVCVEQIKAWEVTEEAVQLPQMEKRGKGKLRWKKL